MKTNSPDTVISRFREIAVRFGSKPAVRGSRTVTYEELDSRSDQVASQLSSLSPETAPVVGLLFAHTPDAVAALLGVMKTGRAFTIIDPGAPLKRKRAIAEEMALEVVIGDPASEPWPDFSGRWIDASAIPVRPIHGGSFRPVSSAAACCIVQTSGTTGQPLGVEISHAALLHTIENYAAMALIVPEDRFTMLTSAAYFAAQTAMFGALLNGACLYPFDVRSCGLAAMADWLEEESLTIYQSPPSLFRAFIRQLPQGRRFPKLRFLRLGGEPVLSSDFELFKKHFSASAHFVNALGVSEAGGNVAYLKVERDSAFAGPLLPVGTPSPGQEVYLADAFGKPVAPGEVGEIVVRSDFLATGYHRRPDLTSQRFRVSRLDGRRELWTGDLGHMTPGGLLMHDGRKDDQVKILGHRVDVAGLESILRSLPEVKEAKMLARQNPGEASELLAFVVPADSGFTAGLIRLKLKELVAAPVFPRVLLTERLPLTPGGKIDRERLFHLAEESSAPPSSSLPRNDTERELAQIWSSVLGVREIGVYDNFFASGGDSLTALSVSSTVEDRFKLPCPPWLFLDRPTIAQMGEYLSAQRKPGPLRPWQRLLTQEKAEQVVELRAPPGKSEAPLFICPGGWGHERELLVFAALLPHLPPGLPVYGLKQNFLGNSAQVAETIEAMAKNFLLEIKKIQPTGPYRLLGECVAGVVILELAHRLELAGEIAETIILLDPHLPKAQPPDTGTESKESSDKVRHYYQILAKAKPRPCTRCVQIIGIEDPKRLRHRLERWNIFEGVQLEISHVSGDHVTYLREHGGELAREIARIISRATTANPNSALDSPEPNQRISVIPH